MKKLDSTQKTVMVLSIVLIVVLVFQFNKKGKLSLPIGNSQIIAKEKMLIKKNKRLVKIQYEKSQKQAKVNELQKLGKRFWHDSNAPRVAFVKLAKANFINANRITPLSAKQYQKCEHIKEYEFNCTFEDKMSNIAKFLAAIQHNNPKLYWKSFIINSYSRSHASSEKVSVNARFSALVVDKKASELLTPKTKNERSR